ncbi:uncharacterized protein LOC109714114 [Ananas comosus]|uniref:Uncharacterized protein LOC109714114 n=1 Tax=Ananas comosus TaxID=4615 RepID=A0A6P5FLY7_ANACO|nr:uncharacterized protein LOC109714114 [Ananas comosus]
MLDKSWMHIQNRLSPEYKEGVSKFLDFAFGMTSGDTIPCPCKKCNNVLFKQRNEVEADLVVNGVVTGYTRWLLHGEEIETIESSDCDSDGESVHDILEAHFGAHNVERWETRDLGASDSEEPNEGATKFFKLLKDGNEQLYPGCSRFSKLSFVIKLFHIKCLSHMTNKGFSMILDLLSKAFPEGNVLPKSYYEAKRIIQDLGLDYKKIDACKNDCMLYWKENSSAKQCNICGLSRWKVCGNGKSKNVPHKILRYFPITPRLQRLFMSTKTASEMTWHYNRIDDGFLSHPSDAKAWKHFDASHQSFAIEPRNVRLGLASDGFNPFGKFSNAYSIWPVVLIPYNLPPWLCMKQEYFMLSLLIPGPCGPGNNIDIYLQPLIDELKELWEVGVETYDAYKKQNFVMHAAILWTINDFPAYGNLSGWVNKGKLACPLCNKDTHSTSLKYGGKLCYLGHRRFLPIKHRWRFENKLFDRTRENRLAPKQLSGDDVLAQLHGIQFPSFGKTIKNRKFNNFTCIDGWKKKSIFFTLPYWRTLLLRHNLDVMHIEKNVCDNILGTLMNIEGKTKDTIKTRLDLKEMHIREELHPRQEGDKIIIPAACYTMTPNEKKIFCEFLAELFQLRVIFCDKLYYH